MKHQRYLWDGEDEIGVINDQNTIEELRILGEGLGAEIGAAILYELKGKTYIPLHDHRGCVVTLIDPNKKQATQCYRYTAFGEQTTPDHLSPWRFSSKRVEEETDLIYFGQRYYMPQLGRWITQDPEGFDDGPNKYAYLHNNPLIYIDPHGLTGLNPIPFYNPMGFTGNILNFFGIGLPYNYEIFEDIYKNKSRNYNLNRDFKHNFPEPSIGAYFFGNGIGNNFSELGEKAYTISTYSGYNTRGTYNATHSLPIDMHEAFMNLVSHTLTTPVHYYHQQWDSYFDNDRTGAPLWQGCHSQGAVQVRNALESYPKERRDRIIVGAFAPFAYISPKLCMQVNHYVCTADAVTYFDFIGKQGCEETITYIRRPPNIRQSCHEFLNPIYAPYIQRSIDNYKVILEKYDH